MSATIIGNGLLCDALGMFRRCCSTYSRISSGNVARYPRVEWKMTPWGKQKPVLIFKAIDSFTRKWSEQEYYGGLGSENVTQATARDVMSNAITVTEAHGYENLLSVHDEGVAETDEDFGSEEEFHELFTTPARMGAPERQPTRTPHRRKRLDCRPLQEGMSDEEDGCV